MKFLIFILLGYILYRVLRGVVAPEQRTRRNDRGGNVDEMVLDPACKTYIPLMNARRKVISGHEYYFCSKECCENFENKIKTKGGA